MCVHNYAQPGCIHVDTPLATAIHVCVHILHVYTQQHNNLI